MPKLATTHSLNNYRKLSISDYRQQLSQLDIAPSAVTLSYSHHSQTIQVSSLPCHYGGVRYYWHCPKCCRRAAVLYCAGSYVCRHCIGANYHSQLIQPIDRLFERVSIIRAKLEWQQGIAQGHGSKPKGMHYSTYDKLVNEHDQLTAKIIGELS